MSLIASLGLASLRAIATPAALAVAIASTASAQTDGEEAEALLAKAAQSCERGHYASTLGAYRELAERYGQTRAGQVATRRLEKNTYLGASDLLRQGPSRNRVDVAIMGDGFELRHQGDFDTLAKVVPRNFERYDVTREYYRYFNFLRVNLASEESGVNEYNREYDTALGAYRSGMVQGQVAVRPERVSAMMAEMAEQDGIAIVFVKNGNLGTGGGGVATVGGRDPKVMIHEFGHAFADLMDEYSANTGHRGLVSSGPNVASTDDEDLVPWSHWLDARVSGVGVYQGADGRPKGAWKPTTNCIMDVGVDFCEVCREAIVLRIYAFVDPIERCEPAPTNDPTQPIVIDNRIASDGPRSVQLLVTTMQPASHDLQATWWVFPREEAKALRPADLERTVKDRRMLEPLSVIDAKPAKVRRQSNGATHDFELVASEYDAGLYFVVCRVEDATRVRGSRHPWVLKDERDLLKSEVGWWVLVRR